LQRDFHGARYSRRIDDLTGDYSREPSEQGSSSANFVVLSVWHSGLLGGCCSSLGPQKSSAPQKKIEALAGSGLMTRNRGFLDSMTVISRRQPRFAYDAPEPPFLLELGSRCTFG